MCCSVNAGYNQGKYCTAGKVDLYLLQTAGHILVLFLHEFVNVVVKGNPVGDSRKMSFNLIDLDLFLRKRLKIDLIHFHLNYLMDVIVVI